MMTTTIVQSSKFNFINELLGTLHPLLITYYVLYGKKWIIKVIIAYRLSRPAIYDMNLKFHHRQKLRLWIHFCRVLKITSHDIKIIATFYTTNSLFHSLPADKDDRKAVQFQIELSPGKIDKKNQKKNHAIFVSCSLGNPKGMIPLNKRTDSMTRLLVCVSLISSVFHIILAKSRWNNYYDCIKSDWIFPRRPPTRHSPNHHF